MTRLDWGISVTYLAGVVLLGFWTSRRVRNSSDYFVSDRRSGKIMMVLFSFCSGTHLGQAATLSAKTYHAGASALWYQWLWLLVTPFYWLLAPLFRRMRAVTTADFFEARYGRGVGSLYAAIGIIHAICSIGLMLKSGAVLIAPASGGHLSPTSAVLLMAVLFVAYGVAGGLNAAILTDFIQGQLTIGLSFLMLPFAFSAVGGAAGLRAAIGDPAMLQIIAPREITAFYVAVISFNALFGWVTLPNSMQICAAGRSDLEVRLGQTCGTFLKRLCAVAWLLTGLCAAGFYRQRGTCGPRVDEVYGLLAGDLLPRCAPGLLGLFLACVSVGVMNSCAAFTVSSAALLTENVYRLLARDRREDRHYLLAGRICSVATVLAAVLYALWLDSVVHGLEVLWRVPAMMGIAFWAGLFWRKATAAGAWAATLASFGIWLFTSTIRLGDRFTLWDFNGRLAACLPAFMRFDGELLLPWQMVLYLGGGAATLVLVSLVTAPRDSDRLDRLYECLRTPVRPGEALTAPLTLPADVLPAPRRVLVNHPDFEVPRPQAITVWGFLVSWCVVGLMIAGVYRVLAGLRGA
jgi:Na+/proline symporter